MWKMNKQSVSSGDDSTNVIAGRDVNLYINENIPTELIDQKIEEEVDRLRKSRFFSEFDRVSASLNFSRLLANGNLSGGSDEVRSRALAWCARLLSLTDDFEKAEGILKHAISLEDVTEAKIAKAFIISQQGDKSAALQTLASINTNASRAAGLMIVVHHEGAENALRWLHNAGYTIGDLDSDGKSVLLSHQLQLGYWDDAEHTVGSLSDTDYEATPILHHLTALTKLVPAVPVDFRAVVLTQVPFEVQSFPLAANTIYMEMRRAAHKHFLDAIEAAEQLDCPRAARISDEYALWLELHDPAQTEHGKNRLKIKLRDADSALGFVHYALQFGIKLDLGLVEQNIERSMAINGGMTIDAALARFALAFAQPTPEKAANYIARHYNQLATYIDSELMRYRQIEMLSRAGLIEKANEVLDRLLEEGIPPEQEKNLRRIISDAQGRNPVEFLKAQYETTKALSDLINLVVQLENHQHWDDLCEFGKLLFEETHSLCDAVRLVNAFNSTQRSKALVLFLKENTDLLSQSNHLRMSLAWGLYNEGEFLESRATLTELKNEMDSPNYRALQVNLGIMSGDWASLTAYIAAEYQSRNKRSAEDLIGAAQLALHLGLHNAKDLLFEAVIKARDDPAVLTTAYFIATSAGWEDDPKVFQWLEKAAKLSNENGPLQRMSLKDILDQKPEWERHESETWRLLVRGQIPIFVAARSLNRTLIDLITFPALTNLTKTDSRRRSAIPAYSGKRTQLELCIHGKTVALDATALLTLSFLNILDAALDAFNIVHIPHSTLGWLFKERQKAVFHQPSRIANAHKIRDLLATDMLEKFTPSTVASSELSAQVGEDLSSLITEAEKVRDGDDTQHIVVCSAPVHRLFSLMEEEADLSAHTAVLSSCLAVVKKLRHKGQITADEEERAQTYLQLQEKPWPNQPDITDGATLYLDDRAITYLLHLGLLGKLKAAGLKAAVSPREVSEVNALISYERISEEVVDVIERIRTALNSRIESGHIKVNSRLNFDEIEGKVIPEHPTLEIMALAHHWDIAIIDDRFINQHENIGAGNVLKPIFTTLDLLDAFVASGVLSEEDRLEHRTRLRQAGYFFVPINEKELEWCLRKSTVVDGEVIETAELKAIRKSILRVRMSDWLQLPEEAPWLDGTLKTFIRVLKNLWKSGTDINVITAQSNWLVEQYDIRGWAHSLATENADNVVRIGRAALISILLIPPTDVQQVVVDAYWNWVEERILAPIQEQFPEVYEWLVNRYRIDAFEIIKTPISDADNIVANTSCEKTVMKNAMLRLIPPLIQKRLFNEQRFREEYGLKVDAMISVGPSGFTVKRSVLFNAIRDVLSGKGIAKMTDTENLIWDLTNDAREDELPRIALSSGQARLVLTDFSVLSKDVSTRIRFLEESAFGVNLPLKAQDNWRSILEERSLEDDEIDAFFSDIHDTPVYVERTIRNEITAGKSSVSSLVPNSRRYFERLVGVYDGSVTIQDYAISTGYKFFEQLLKWQPYEGFLFSLLLSSHSALTTGINIDHLMPEQLEKAFDYLEKHGDMLSRLGALEVGLRILTDRPEVGSFLLRLVYLIRDDDVKSDTSEFKLFSALFVLVDGELARIRLFADEPPFYRRLASLAHAGLIHRQVVQCDIDYDRFIDWTVSNGYEHYYMQTLVDMRSEPRWDPDFAIATQMQADFFGRIMIAGNSYEANISQGELRETILGDCERSLIKLSEFPYPYLPGPLEGAESNPNTLPDDIAHIIEEQLNSDAGVASSFVALVNSAMIFRVTPGHAELALKALKLGNYTLAKLKNKSQLLGILKGLATVAAVSRNMALADDLRILVRRYRRDSQYGFSIEEAMKMCLVASASREDRIKWREFAGEWLTELAFEELKGSEDEILYSHLLALLHLAPELWVSCARADAALKAIV